MLKRMVICPGNTRPVVMNKHPGLVRQVEGHGCCSVRSQLFDWTFEEHIFEKLRRLTVTDIVSSQQTTIFSIVMENLQH